MRIMCHNVWGMYAGYPIQKVANRSELMAEIYLSYLPDVIGMQEFSPDIRQSGLPELIGGTYTELDLRAEMNAYEIENVYTPIFYRPEVCRPVRQGLVLYDKPYNNRNSKGVAYAVFEQLTDGARFSVCNTHYWWKKCGPEHDAARESNSGVILSLCRDLPHPTVVMGDLNCRAESEAYQLLLRNGLADVQACAAQSMDSNTCHKYPSFQEETGVFYGAPRPEGGYQRAIDHMLISGDNSGDVSRFEVITSQNACDTSDHCPIYMDFSLTVGSETEVEK